MSKPDKKPPIRNPAKLFYCRWSRSSHRRSRRAPPLMKPRLRRWLSAFYRTGCCSPSACARQATTSTSLWQGSGGCGLPPGKAGTHPGHHSDFDDSETAALGLLENLQRAQLDAFDAARGIREVIRLWNCTQAEAARRLGLSQPALANKLRLLTLTTAQQQLCTAAGLTERHARAVLRLPESRRTAALEKIARDKLSVREADRLVDAMLAAPKDTPGPCRSTVPMVGDVRLFVNTLQHAVDLMTQRGIPAVTSCEQADGFLEYTVRIPTATPAPRPVPNTLPACHEPEMPSGEGSSLGEEDELVRS